MENMNTDPIGVAGLGYVGRGIAACFLSHGFRVVGYTVGRDTHEIARDYIGNAIAELIEKGTGVETRAVVLGHIQRGGAPSAYDRVLATRFGVRAADLVAEKKFGVMVSLQGTRITDVPLVEATGTLKTVPESFYEMIQGVSG